MKLYNQNDYPNVSYPSKSLPGATVKSGGCGVVCMMILLANMAGVEMSAEQAARYAMDNGARVEGGTDMTILCKCLVRDHGFTLELSNDAEKLVKHVAQKGWAVANVSGDRSGYTGVYSDGGHYVIVTGGTKEKLVVLDPAYYPGKFAKAGRSEKVQDIGGGVTSCAAAVLADDTKTRRPAYYLLSRKGFQADKFADVSGHWAQEDIRHMADLGILKGKDDGLYHPDEPMTRAEFAAAARRLMEALNK